MNFRCSRIVIAAGVVLLSHRRGGKQPGLLHGQGHQHSPVEYCEISYTGVRSGSLINLE